MCTLLPPKPQIHLQNQCLYLLPERKTTSWKIKVSAVFDNHQAHFTTTHNTEVDASPSHSTHWKYTKCRLLLLGIKDQISCTWCILRMWKVKWSRYRPGVAQRVDRGIALLFHDRGTRRGWVVSSTPRPHFKARERPGTHCKGGWVGPKAGLDGRKISSPPGFDPGPSSP